MKQFSRSKPQDYIAHILDMLLALPLCPDNCVSRLAERFPVIFHGTINFDDKVVSNKKIRAKTTGQFTLQSNFGT